MIVESNSRKRGADIVAVPLVGSTAAGPELDESSIASISNQRADLCKLRM